MEEMQPGEGTLASYLGQISLMSLSQVSKMTKLDIKLTIIKNALRFNHERLIGDNGTIDGQGLLWWQKFHGKKLKYTRPYLLEIMYSDTIQISNLTFLNSPSWNVHPVYSR